MPQHEVYDGSGYVVRLDFAWPEERVALHVDGYASHHQRRQFERDRTVANRLAALGWCSTWVTHRSLDDDRWLDSLRKVLKERAPQLRLI